VWTGLKATLFNVEHVHVRAHACFSVIYCNAATGSLGHVNTGPFGTLTVTYCLLKKITGTSRFALFEQPKITEMDMGGRTQRNGSDKGIYWCLNSIPVD